MPRVLFALLCVLAPGVAAAHPLHTTLTELRWVPGTSGEVVEIRIRAFTDDFSAAVARAAGRQPPRDSSVVVAEAIRYLTSRVGLRTSGRVVPLVWCGMRTERGVVWVCLRTVTRVPRAGLSMRQSMHIEVYDDQVNLVQVISEQRRASTLFVRDEFRRVGG